MINCLFGNLIIGMYLIYNVQLITGKVGLSYEMDDYISAVLELYIDVIKLFFEIFKIIRKTINKRN